MTQADALRRVVLVRHTSVEDACRGRCYGSSDVALSEQGRQEARELAARVANWPITHLFHSGLTRSRDCAELIAGLCGVAAIAAPELAEMHFGDWELCTWDAIHAAAPDALDRLLAEPATFAPPGGETLLAMRDRVLHWYRKLPAAGFIVAVSHGGPIAALRGTLAGLPPAAWPQLIPPHGEPVELE
ncbi:MAG TPA: histidine phosphatase family protein [Pirellulales bacterium]